MTSETGSAKSSGVRTKEGRALDAVIVGAGFAGLYMLHRLRSLGLEAVVYEAATGVGGTWFWNRYPGARCDAESLGYSFSFSPELEQEWEWSERYATQPEILRYLNHVADRFDLRRDIGFERRVAQARWDEAGQRWKVDTEHATTGHDKASIDARFLIMATGCLSVPTLPAIEGRESFAGETYQTSLWPHEGVDFTGKRVGVIGTGSSGIQSIPLIAEQASQLSVFQRTPNYSVPAHNAELSSDFVRGLKAEYPEHRERYRRAEVSTFGDITLPLEDCAPVAEKASDLSPEAQQAALEERWSGGGIRMLATFGDIMTDPESNEVVAEFVRGKIREIVDDPETAELLCPRSHPIGSKRMCVDTGYYATYNRANVELVDLQSTPIDAITPKGIRTQGREFELDAIVFATGFDALTGALLRIDVRGRDGVELRDHWAEGPRSYLGLSVSGFPNFFTITGPGSPSVLSNMVISIEQHVQLIADCLEYMREKGASSFEPDSEAEEGWMGHVNQVADMTLYPKAGSWYLGANIPGKPRVFMPYVAGIDIYRQVCEGMIEKDWEGFSFR